MTGGRDLGSTVSPEGLGNNGVLIFEGLCVDGGADRAPRSATVVATTETRVLVIDGEGFRRLLANRPVIGEVLLRVLSERLRTMTRTPPSSS